MNHDPILSLEKAYVSFNISFQAYGAFCLANRLLDEQSFIQILSHLRAPKATFQHCQEGLVIGHQMFRGNN